jgi:hypothetical protein
MAHLPPGLGIYRCTGLTRAGRPCTAWVVQGFDRCLHHVDDADLAEAEAVMGFIRCRHPSGCLFYAVKGSRLCKVHGCNQGSAQWVNAQLRAGAIEIAEQYLGLRTYRKRRGVPVKVTWRRVA